MFTIILECLPPGKPLQPSLMSCARPEPAFQVLHISVSSPTLPTNITQRWKGLPGTNILAYYEYSQITAVKSFITMDPVFSRKPVENELDLRSGTAPARNYLRPGRRAAAQDQPEAKSWWQIHKNFFFSLSSLPSQSIFVILGFSVSSVTDKKSSRILIY